MLRRWMIGCLLLSSPLLLADSSPRTNHPGTEDQLKVLDSQIQAISVQIDSYRHKAMDAEAEAQTLMTSNFTQYIAKIQESQGFEELARNADKQMKLLEAERKDLIDRNNTSPSPTFQSK